MGRAEDDGDGGITGRHPPEHNPCALPILAGPVGADDRDPVMVPDGLRHLELFVVNAGATEDGVPEPGRVRPGVVNQESLLGLG